MFEAIRIQAALNMTLALVLVLYLPDRYGAVSALKYDKLFKPAAAWTKVLTGMP